MPWVLKVSYIKSPDMVRALVYALYFGYLFAT